MEMSHQAIVGDLVRALYAHGKIIGERRAAEFSNLLAEQPKLGLTIPELLEAIAKTDGDRIEGYIEIAPGSCISTWSALLRALNLLACYLWKSFEFANSISALRPHPRLDSTLEFLPHFLECDRRWRVVTPEHVERLSVQAGTFSRKPGNPYSVDIDAVRSWARARCG